MKQYYLKPSSLAARAIRFSSQPRLLQLALLLVSVTTSTTNAADPPGSLRPWLDPQTWQRDTDGPVVSLGDEDAFDDTHIFAPCVARLDERYFLWYCGSQGSVAKRVFALGLSTSGDGREFEKHPKSPVYTFGDGEHSILTPTLLRETSGVPIREDGKLRMWFSSTHFAGGKGLHTLHETTSEDGISWSPPSATQLENVYAPSIIKEGGRYRMWYVDVSSDPWVFKHAQSKDGRAWQVTPDPVVVLDQSWERGRLFYPAVIKTGDLYLMWYGSYWAQEQSKTALGFAVSLDGITWHKNPHNPVFRPDESRPWESHYTTSQSVIRFEDGSFRLWYASRKKPPFVNKYFAIGTAKWAGPKKNDESGDKPSNAETQCDREATERSGAQDETKSPQPRGAEGFAEWQTKTRRVLSEMLGIPETRVPLMPESRGQIEVDDIVIEKWIYTSEPGSRVPAVLYRPKNSAEAMPAVVLTFGHGGSKSQAGYNYIGQLYAKLGVACLAADPVGEEERHKQGRMGTRAHDPKDVHLQAWNAGRPIMGKLVFDTMRGIDFLLARDDIDPERIGVAGNSLGGAKAGWMAALEPRLKMAIISGWAFDDVTIESKFCTRVPNEHMRQLLSWGEYASLAAPNCAVLFTNGDADVIIDKYGDGRAWRGTQDAVKFAARQYAALGRPDAIRSWLEPQGGHRPYPAHREGAAWMVEHLRPRGWTVEKVRALPEINFGRWADANGIQMERLYGTPLHRRGATVVDMNIRYSGRAQLAVLRPDEIGRPDYTLDGWLEQVSKR